MKPATPAGQASDPRIARMLADPILPTLLRMSWPNVLMMLAMSSTSIVEMWLLAKLGTDVLAGVAVVVPLLILMQNMSQGALGGIISAVIAQALGAGDTARADSLARHAVVLSALIGLVFSVVLLLFSAPLFRFLGAEGAALEAALAYGRVVFANLVPLWVLSALASVVRGTGNMLLPGAVICGGAVLLIPVCAALIFGFGPIPAFGAAGSAMGLAIYYSGGALVLGWYCISGRNLARLRRGALRWTPMRNILSLGSLACLNPLFTNAIIATTTAIVGAYAGIEALAGYATAVRLEYFLIPIAFGVGAPMVALVGANIGAGQAARARNIALVGGGLTFAVGTIVGVGAALWPQAWLGLFSTNVRLIETGAHYLQIVGPFYGFFSMGIALYFASQGARRLKWPLLASILRLLLFAGVGSIVLAVAGSLTAFFVIGAIAMFAYGSCVLWAVASGRWFTPTETK